MVHIKKLNENSLADRLSNFYSEYRELCNIEDFDNIDLWTEIGQLTLKYKLTKSEVKHVLENFNCRFDINRFLEQTLKDWDKNTGESWDSIFQEVLDNNIRIPMELRTYLKKSYKVPVKK
jgi:hypothetical protein